MKKIAFLALAILLAPIALARAEGAPDALFAADASYKYEVASTEPLAGGTVTAIHLTSQTWHDIVWEHWVRVFEPAHLRHPDAAVLVIGGGRNRPDAGPLRGQMLALPGIAEDLGALVVYLEEVPNQPLFGDLREDALIAYTFQKFLETKDESWPALVPMTRAAMRCMDAVQDLTSKRGRRVERFFVTGGSKRGWTTWLAAAHDARVAALAPMVIDVVNMKAQMPHQVETFGGYSQQIQDYTRLGLTDKVVRPEARRLLEIVDPWCVRERLTQPKLIVLGTNDPYWPCDAVNLYFDDLAGEKEIHYVPNAEHGLDLTAAVTAAAFFGEVLEGVARPRLEFSDEKEMNHLWITARVASGEKPVRAELWSATAPTRDFRRARWKSEPVERRDDGTYSGSLLDPTVTDVPGCRAGYLALTFKDARGKELSLCSPIQIVGTPVEAKPAAKKEPALF
jgi:PhoPQ-activated pathogenicity-related protein